MKFAFFLSLQERSNPKHVSIITTCTLHYMLSPDPDNHLVPPPPTKSCVLLYMPPSLIMYHRYGCWPLVPHSYLCSLPKLKFCCSKRNNYAHLIWKMVYIRMLFSHTCATQSLLPKIRPSNARDDFSLALNFSDSRTAHPLLHWQST